MVLSSGKFKDSGSLKFLVQFLLLTLNKLYFCCVQNRVFGKFTCGLKILNLAGIKIYLWFKNFKLGRHKNLIVFRIFNLECIKI
jgi:hypothetical protein